MKIIKYLWDFEVRRPFQAMRRKDPLQLMTVDNCIPNGAADVDQILSILQTCKCFIDRQDYEGAFDSIKSLLCIDEGLFEIWKGFIFEKKGDRKASHQSYSTALRLGKIEAAIHLGRLYQTGTGGERSEAVALGHYVMAAKEGNLYAIYKLGMYFKRGIMFEADYKRAFKLFLTAAEGGLPEALNQVGICYYVPLGTEMDLKKAEKYFQLAIKKGFNSSIFNLARLYMEIHDFPKAFDLMKSLAISGDLQAQRCISYMYRNGIGTAIDYKESFVWLEKCAQSNYSRAVADLANMYYYGLHVPKDLNKAFDLYNLSAKTFQRGGLHWLLGRCYQHGLGTDVDLEKSYECYHQALKRGVPNYFIQSIRKDIEDVEKAIKSENI